MKSYPLEGYVYFLEAPGGLYKIGRAAEVTTRLKQIQPAYPHPLEFRVILYSLDAVADEKMLHEKFKKTRLNGEWFKLNQDDLELRGINNPRMTYQQYLESKQDGARAHEISMIYKELSRYAEDKDYIHSQITRLVELKVLDNLESPFVEKQKVYAEPGEWAQ